MQSSKSRAALVAAALAIAVVAFLVLRPTDEDPEPAPTTAAERSEQAGDEGDDDAGRGAGNGAAGQGDGAAEAATTEIELRNGDVVGGVQEIEVERGERIEFAVISDAPDEIHVHGYELTKDVRPDRPARFSFTADAEGIYEVEAHDIGHALIAELRVTPS